MRPSDYHSNHPEGSWEWLMEHRILIRYRKMERYVDEWIAKRCRTSKKRIALAWFHFMKLSPEDQRRFLLEGTGLENGEREPEGEQEKETKGPTPFYPASGRKPSWHYFP